MTAKEKNAIRALWDALSEYLEESLPDHEPAPGSIRELGLKAIQQAQEVWPNGVSAEI